MKKTRLIQFLKSLTPIEIKGMKDVVLSPAFNKNPQLVSLFDILEKYYPSFESDELTEELLFENLFKKEKYDYHKMKNLTSDLLSLGKEFLAFNSYRKKPEEKDILLMWELRIRNLDIIFEHTFKNASNRLDNTKEKSFKYYGQRLALQDEKIFYYTPKMPNVKFEMMQEKLDLQIEHTLLTLLHTYNIMLHEYSQNNVNYDLKMFAEAMDYLKKNVNGHSPALIVCYHVILLSIEKNDENFRKLYQLHEKYKSGLPPYDNYMTQLLLDSYCATAFNLHGRTDLMKIQFDLSVEYSQNLLPELGRILYPNFLNDVKKAVRVGDFGYAEDYIKKYQNNLSEEKENTINFCKAFIAYGKKNYDEALDLLSQTNFSNFIIKIQVRLLLLQLFYEKKHYDQATLMIDTIRKYVSREKMLIETTRTSLLEFLKVTGSLIRYNTDAESNRTSDALHKIEFDISNLKNNQYGYKLWLIEKSKELTSTL